MRSTGDTVSDGGGVGGDDGEPEADLVSLLSSSRPIIIPGRSPDAVAYSVTPIDCV